MSVLNGKRLAFIFGTYAGIFSLYTLVSASRPYVWIAALALSAFFIFRLFFTEKPKNISKRKIALVVLMLAASFASMLFGTFFVEKTEKRASEYIGASHTAQGYITDIHYDEPYGASYEAVLTEIGGTKTEIGAVITIPFSCGFSEGDTISVSGIFEKPEGEDSLYRKADGILLAVSAEFAEKTGISEKNTFQFFENVRTWIKTNFEKNMENDTAGFASALLTGDRSSLAGGIRLAFMRLGISHLLAVSGLHLSIFVGGADMLLSLLTVPKKKKNWILIAFSVFFACVCGLSSSVLRAAIMLSIYYLADILGEKSDPVTSLFFALSAILTARPASVYDVGLWLSFLSTFGILTVMPVLNFSFFPKMPRILRKICRFLLASLAMTLTATFFTMPVTYLVFGDISLVSPLANLLFVPLIQILLYLLVLLTVFGLIPFIAPLLSGFSSFLIESIVSLAQRLSDIKDIYISIRYPFAVYIIAALAIGILIVLFSKKLRPAWIFAVFLFCTLAFGCAYGIYRNINADISYVYLQTDGKSDVIGIVSGGETALVDISTGGSAMPEEAYKDLADFYECEIDAYILTHYHSYHANTLRKLSENIKIHKLLLPIPLTENDEKYYRDILIALDQNTEIALYETGEETIGAITLFLPERAFLKRSAHPVISFSATIGENGKRFSYLSSSALEITKPEAEVIILGAHGPIEKHIFDASLLQSAEITVFSEKKTADLTETEHIGGTFFFAEEYGGYFRIAFAEP